MKTILVCNQKGGVGKSLVADEIAFSFERSGIPVSFYDLDTQGGTLHETHEADGAQVAVVDTPGALQEGLADWLKEADVVVIPTRTTSRDIEPLMRMRKAVFKNSRAKIVYVMNGWVFIWNCLFKIPVKISVQSAISSTSVSLLTMDSSKKCFPFNRFIWLLTYSVIIQNV